MKSGPESSLPVNRRGRALGPQDLAFLQHLLQLFLRLQPGHFVLFQT